MSRPVLSRHLLNLGSAPNDGTGDPLRDGGQRINAVLLRLAAGQWLEPVQGFRNAPPAAPAPGERWIVGNAPSGDWAAYSPGYVVEWIGGDTLGDAEWIVEIPAAGAHVADRTTPGAPLTRRWSGSAWVDIVGAVSVTAANVSLAAPATGGNVQIAIEALQTATAGGPFVPAADVGQPDGVCDLDASGLVPLSRLPSAIVGALKFKGVWNASTNTPSITTGSASPTNTGDIYIVSVAGTTTVDGISDWSVADWIVSDGAAWRKIENTDQVTSFAGRVGAVTPADGDYAAAQIAVAPAVEGAADVQAALEALSGRRLALTAAEVPLAPALGEIDDVQQALETLLAAAPPPPAPSGDFKGYWDAAANQPPIPPAAPANANWYYIVETAGTTEIDGTAAWGQGDWIQSTGSFWAKIDNQANPNANASPIGKHTIWLPARAFAPAPASGAAQPDRATLPGGAGYDHIAFAAGESAIAPLFLPQSWNAGRIEVRVVAVCPTAGSGTIAFEAAAALTVDGALPPAPDFGLLTGAGVSGAVTADVQITAARLAGAAQNPGKARAGELHLRRAAGTYAGLVRVRGVELTYTTNQANDAAIPPPTNPPPPPDQRVYDQPGTYSWTPDFTGVVSVVCVGGGQASGNGTPAFAGSGGDLRWANDIPVTAGVPIEIVVAAGGNSGSPAGGAGTGPSARGGDSRFGTALIAKGGGSPTASTPLGGAVGGGDGGSPGVSRSGGGGAGGYAGPGGPGGGYTGGPPQAGTLPASGSGAPAGGLSYGYYADPPPYGSHSGAQGGGGVGLGGLGPAGAAPGKAGSAGTDGTAGGYGTLLAPVSGGNGGKHGGGGGHGTLSSYFQPGGAGGVRIIWGAGRSFPDAAA